MESAYAQALWQVVEKGTAPAKAIGALREMLERQGREKLLPKIARAFARIYERERLRHGLVLYVAREGDARSAADAAARAVQEMRVAATEFDVRIDDSLIGGWRLEGGGVLVDKSYRKQLLDMYNRSII